jgi:hypothetical protein
VAPRDLATDAASWSWRARAPGPNSRREPAPIKPAASRDPMRRGGGRERSVGGSSWRTGTNSCSRNNERGNRVRSNKRWARLVARVLAPPCGSVAARGPHRVCDCQQARAFVWRSTRSVPGFGKRDFCQMLRRDVSKPRHLSVLLRSLHTNGKRGVRTLVAFGWMERYSMTRLPMAFLLQRDLLASPCYVRAFLSYLRRKRDCRVERRRRLCVFTILGRRTPRFFVLW